MSSEGAPDARALPAPEIQVTEADVRHAYGVLLGRSPENEGVLKSKVGQSRSALMGGIIGSSEFIDTVLPRLHEDKGLPDREFSKPVSHERRAWSDGFFKFEKAAFDRLGDVCTGAEFLAACLEQQSVRERVDAIYPPGTAEALAAIAGPHQRFSRSLVRPGPASASTLDLANCYRLFHGREPESKHVVLARPETPAAEVALDFILSQEFNDNILATALNGRLDQAALVEGSLKEWAEDTFEVQLPKFTTRPALIGEILRQAWLAMRLRERRPSFPAGPLASALTRVGAASSEAFVAIMASGVDILKVEGLRPLGVNGRVHYTTHDPWIEFRVSGEAAASDLVLLQFGFSAANIESAKIYLDYGSGLREEASLLLHSWQGPAFEAVVARSSQLQRIRLDPTDLPSYGEFTLLAAKALSEEDAVRRLSSSAHTASGLLRTVLAEATADPNASAAVALSRLLSPQAPTAYQAWLTRNEPNGVAAERLWREQLRQLRARPLISVLTPTYNTPVGLLREAVESVRAQVYPNWELCVADDASTDPDVLKVLAEYVNTDPRIKVVLRPENGHISAASNSALQLVQGEWMVLFDHDDLLRPNALLAIAQEINAHPDVQLIYSDEDKIDGSVRSAPYFKPEYSPELLLAQNYFNHLTAHRTENVRRVGGWRLGFEGSQDYDLNLRILEHIRPGQVRHIPEVLYHWRIVEGSTALATGEKSYALDAGLHAVQEHLQRVHPGAEAEALVSVPFYRVRPRLPTPAPSVSLIIPTRDKPDILNLAVRSILERSTYSDYEIIIVDNGSSEPATFELLDELATDDRVRVLSYSGRFNYPALNNYAARLARGEILGLVNNDIEVISPDWIEEMASWAIQDEIGCVGAKLLYPDMSVQHAGVVVGVGGVAGHGHKHARRTDPGYFGRLQVHSNVSAVTAACLLVRRKVFEEVRGLDEGLAIAFNDVDFCLRVREAGYRNLFTPFAELVHHESKSRGTEDTPDKVRRFTAEVEFMLDRWGEMLTDDPFYSPNLSYETDDFALGESRYRRQSQRAAA